MPLRTLVCLLVLLLFVPATGHELHILVIVWTGWHHSHAELRLVSPHADRHRHAL